MNTDTTIAKNIRVTDEKASYDAACKRLLSEKIILAWIMKNCVEEYKNCDVNEIAENAFDECDSLTIKGKSGSYAEEYAKENDIDFVAE